MLRNPKYKYGPKDVKVPCSLNLGEFLLETIVNYKERTAFIDGITNEEVTYGEILQNAMNLAVSLRRLGIRKGEVVAICSEHRAEFWPAVVGIICAGAVLTPVSNAFTKDKMEHILGISKPKYMFSSPRAYETYKTSFKSLKFIEKIILFGNEKKSEVLYRDLISNDVKYEDFLPVEVQGQTDTVVIFFTSGSTTSPKGVMITHLNALAAVCNVKEADLTPEKVTMSFATAPWHQSFSFKSHMRLLCNGRTMIYMKKFDQKQYFELIQRYKPQFIKVVPPIVKLLSESQILEQYDFSSVQYIMCGAAPLNSDTINNVKTRFPNLQDILQGYGMSESTQEICRNVIDSPSGNKTGSVGPVTSGLVVKVVDLETRVPLGPNQQGEICVGGVFIMKGYLGKDRKEELDKEGFFKTGDIGYYDEDGFFYIIDRLKELIKCEGFQVAPAEIRSELLQLPAVRDAAVIGIPNKAFGEVVLAYVVKQPGYNITENEIREYIASKLSSPKHLRGGVKFIEAIPRNPSGKILNFLLKDMVKS